MRTLKMLLLCGVLALAGCGARPEIKKVVLTDQVDAQQAPTRAVELFPAGARVFYLAVLVSDPNKGTQIKVRWQFEGKLVDEYVLSLPDGKDRWISFDLQAPQGFPKGRYQAEVFLDNAPVRAVEFSVQ